MKNFIKLKNSISESISVYVKDGDYINIFDNQMNNITFQYIAFSIYKSRNKRLRIYKNKYKNHARKTGREENAFKELLDKLIQNDLLRKTNLYLAEDYMLNDDRVKVMTSYT